MTRDIDVVIIGVNSEKTLDMCIKSVLDSDYSNGRINIIYSDGGSIDNSRNIAKKYSGVKVLELHLENPTPGKQRNEGWLAGNSPYVQFLDSDTLLDKKWLATAVQELEANKCHAICGNRNEINPNETIFNWLGNLEWNPSYGKVDAFGGDVMIRRDILENTKGYNSTLIAGEDPELSYRIKKQGFEIIRLDVPMTMHDLGMKKPKQYWKRAYRTGYAYIECFLLTNEMWKNDVKRIMVRGGAYVLALIFAIASIWNILFLFPLMFFLFIAFRPRLMLVNKFAKEMLLERREAIVYAWHVSFVVLPQLFGMLRYLIGKLLKKPLKNKIKKLKTGG